MKKVAIYCRQSLKKEDSLSIPKQEEDCRNSLKTDEKDLVVVYKDQKSGKNTDREGFIEMIGEVKKGNISKVVVWKLDRISRNLSDFCEMYSTFEEHETAFCSVNDNFDTSSPLGMCMLKIAMVFAEMERKNTQMRVTDNFYNRIKEDGRWACGIAPYGFKNAKVDKISTLVTNEKEIEAVKECFDKYAHSPNTSLGQLARWLMENGYKSHRKNGSWDSVAVMRILKSPVYAVADERLKKYYNTKGITIVNEERWTGETSCQIVGKTQTILKDGKEQRGKVATGSKVHGLILFKKHTGDNAVYGMEEAVKERTVIQEKLPELFINGKNTMPVGDIDQLKGHGRSALHGVEIPTGRAETAVAAERDKF